MRRTVWSRIAVIGLVLVGAHAAIGQEPNLPPPPSPQVPHLEPAQPTPHGAPPEAMGSAALFEGSYDEISRHYAHYRAQAFRYQWIDRIARLVILLGSTAAALTLALKESPRAKRVAIVLSMVVASVQAADQQFKLSEMREVSWRTAVELSRVLSEFREEWLFSGAAQGNPDEAMTVVRRYRGRFNEAVEREMNVSLAPIAETH